MAKRTFCCSQEMWSSSRDADTRGDEYSIQRKVLQYSSKQLTLFSVG